MTKAELVATLAGVPDDAEIRDASDAPIVDVTFQWHRHNGHIVIVWLEVGAL